jgi:hypothetical protein
MARRRLRALRIGVKPAARIDQGTNDAEEGHGNQRERSRRVRPQAGRRASALQDRLGAYGFCGCIRSVALRYFLA